MRVYMWELGHREQQEHSVCHSHLPRPAFALSRSSKLFHTRQPALVYRRKIDKYVCLNCAHILTHMLARVLAIVLHTTPGVSSHDGRLNHNIRSGA